MGLGISRTTGAPQTDILVQVLVGESGELMPRDTPLVVHCSAQEAQGSHILYVHCFLLPLTNLWFIFQGEPGLPGFPGISGPPGLPVSFPVWSTCIQGPAWTKAVAVAG